MLSRLAASFALVRAVLELPRRVAENRAEPLTPCCGEEVDVGVERVERTFRDRTLEN